MLFPEYAREGYSIVWGRQHRMNEPLMLITYAPWDGLEIMTYSIEENSDLLIFACIFVLNTKRRLFVYRRFVIV